MGRKEPFYACNASQRIKPNAHLAARHALLCGGCDKPLFKTDEASIAQPDELPPMTTIGEGTFQCVAADDICVDTIYITDSRR